MSASSIVNEDIASSPTRIIEQDQVVPQHESLIVTEDESDQNCHEQQTENTYYGATSTLFNADNDGLQSTTQLARGRQIVSPMTIQNSLVAAAAKQSEFVLISVLQASLMIVRTVRNDQLQRW